MSENDNERSGVLGALRESLDGVTMQTPVEQIVAVGRARRRRRGAGAVVAAVGVAGLTLGATAYLNQSVPADVAADSSASGAVHVQTAAYTVDSNPDGTVRVAWSKERYFEDHEGLQAALRRAGFPVLIKVGEFCRGPHDDGRTDASGVGPGVDKVMKGERGSDEKVTFVFTPAAVPAGKQLFIGYLTPAQLEVTHGRPGSVERLVPTGAHLICTTDLPTGH
jgi:hypothetical protein